MAGSPVPRGSAAPALPHPATLQAPLPGGSPPTAWLREPRTRGWRPLSLGDQVTDREPRSALSRLLRRQQLPGRELPLGEAQEAGLREACRPPPAPRARVLSPTPLRKRGPARPRAAGQDATFLWPGLWVRPRPRLTCLQTRGQGHPLSHPWVPGHRNGDGKGPRPWPSEF